MPVPDGQHGQQQSRTQAPKKQATKELLIVVRGQRATGKTTLVSRMKGGAFLEQYDPTPFMEASEIPYQPDSIKSDILSVKVLDVVEKALAPDGATEESEYPDATTIDTYKRADGLVIVIDVRHKDTIDLAAQIIRDAPLDLPIVVYSNFQDVEKVTPVIPETLQQLIGKFTFIPGSLKSNLGLVELSDWLVIPYLFSKKKQYLALYNSISDDLDDTLRISHEAALNFLTLDLAKKNMPKPPMRPVVKSPPPQPQQQQPSTANATPAQQQQQQSQEPGQRTQKPAGKPWKIKPKKPADDFFSDGDDDNDDALVLSDDPDFNEDLAPNPLVQAVPDKHPKKQLPAKSQTAVKPEAKASPNTATAQNIKPIVPKPENVNANEPNQTNENQNKNKPTLFDQAPKLLSAVAVVEDEKPDAGFFDDSNDDSSEPEFDENIKIKKLPPIPGFDTIPAKAPQPSVPPATPTPPQAPVPTPTPAPAPQQQQTQPAPSNPNEDERGLPRRRSKKLHRK